jgi:flavin-dependent dehydrogenase
MFYESSSPVQSGKKQSQFSRAVVIGGSIAGLTAARVLSDHFDKVTVIERGPMADGVEFPKGVPQSRHPHILLIRGERILEDHFPGFKQDLIDGGAKVMNFGRDLKMRFPGGWLPQYQTEMQGIAASRKLIDFTVYQHVAQIPNINFKPDSEVVSICTDDDNRRVIGVQIHNRADGRVEDVPAELIVDASGRNSKAPHWLAQLGYAAPEDNVVNAFPGYASRIYEIPKNFDKGWKTMYIMPNPPEVTRGAIIIPMEGDLWHVTLIGMNRDNPPTDEAGFMKFARSLVSSDIYDALNAAMPVSPIWGYRRAENRMRRYDIMEKYLEGFVALGDAVYALNPVYGQGMTLASIASTILDQCVAEQAALGQGDDFTGMAEKFQKMLSKELVMPWQTATNEDMRWPETEGKQDLDAASRFIGRYFNLVLQAMPHSVKVTDAFFHVQHMIAPPTILMHPVIMFTVLKTNLFLRFSRQK